MAHILDLNHGKVSFYFHTREIFSLLNSINESENAPHCFRVYIILNTGLLLLKRGIYEEN